MRRALSSTAALLALLSLAACATAPPAGPNVLASPGPGRSFGQFSIDDGRCRQYASGANHGVTPQGAAAGSGVATAAAGTAIGAAAGALLGAAGGAAGFGAAFGAGTGLLFGSAIGTGNAAESAHSVQANYDRVYAQCMIASGDTITLPPVVGMTPGYGYTPYGAYGPLYRPARMWGSGW